ncbi:MAG: hypothetical protein J1F16_05970 [Muribaculaceae bacterium]|nr:hypothetical protein [Muribaculaceae bacterium]
MGFLKNNGYICNMRYIWQRPGKDIAVAILFLGVLCLLIFSAVWAWRQYISTPPYVDEKLYPVRGIDVSRHNGEIDFKKVKESGIDFVFVKASEGVNHRDSLFARNIDRAHHEGLKTGAYHFFRFDSNGIDQALNFLRAVGSRQPELGLVIDVESSGNPSGIPVDEIKKQLTMMVEYMNLLGYRVMIYTNLDGYYDYIEDILPGYPLWICRFKENPINAEWTFWQYDHHGKVDGVKGDVDLNAFMGDRKAWERYLNGAVWPYE